MSSSLNLHEIKAELKTLGCKLKTQLDGSWAIHEPRGNRVIVPTLDEVQEYCRAKSRQTTEIILPQGDVQAAEISVKKSVEQYAESESVVEPVVAEPPSSAFAASPVFVATPVLQVETITPAPAPAPESPVAAIVVVAKPVPDTVAMDTRQTQIAATPLVAQTESDRGNEAASALQLSHLRVDLKKLGCKLKSQLDGSWCIDESKGKRTIVRTLNEVQAYINSKNGNAASEIKPALVQPVVAPSIAPPSVVISTASVEPLAVSRPAQGMEQVAQPKPAISPEQMEALSIVNQLFRDMNVTRLPQGLNFLHSEIAPYLVANNCPMIFMEKALHYADAKLQKYCMDKILVKRVFKNHRGQEDAMYFAARYVSVLSPD